MACYGRPVTETLMAELRRYLRFGESDEAALRALSPHLEPHRRRITEEFYDRVREHEGARLVFESDAQVERLKVTLVEWMRTLCAGPWDEAYYTQRARIGRVHVRIGLPQRYMFAAMNLIRISLTKVAQEAFANDAELGQRVVGALAKIVDIELAIMLETYGDAYVAKVQKLERREHDVLVEQLAYSEAQYAEIVEGSWTLVATADAEGRILVFNKRCEELTGLSRAEALGRDWFALFVEESEQKVVRGRCNEALLGARVLPYEGAVQHSGGNRFRVRWHFTTVPTAAGPLLCALGLDVTEERDLQLRTRRAERMASLGMMAAGLAHEIRNPLNAAHLQLTLLQRRLGRTSGADVQGALEASALVQSEMSRLAGLVDEFLQFARPQPLRLARIDATQTMGEIVRLMAPEAAGAGVLLRGGEEGADPVRVEADDEKLKQVLLNLVRNAIEATGEGGNITLRAVAREGGALLEVEDDGPGLPSPEAPIFEPFFTTKTSGTGLGLAIVHRIVSDHGGRISVESRPGRTVFSVVLPGASP